MAIIRAPRAKSALRVAVVAAVLGAMPLFASPSEGATSTFSNLNPIRFSGHPGLPPPWAADLYPSNIDVSGLSGTVSDLNVTIRDFTCVFTANSVGEEYPEDVDVALVGPTGTTTILMSDVFGDNQTTTTFENVTITLNDEAAEFLPFENPVPPQASNVSLTAKPSDDDNDPDENGIASPPDQENPGRWLDLFPAPGWPSSATGPAPEPPSFNPNGLAIFDGTNPNGTWSLYMADDFAGPEWCDIRGGWSIEVTTGGTAEPTTTTTAPGSTTTAPPTTAAPTTTTTAPQTDLVMDLTGPASARAGRKITFTMSVTNQGPVTAVNVILSDNLPTGFTVASVNRVKGMTCTRSGSLVQCSVASLAPGKTVSAAISGSYSPAGTYTNFAGVGSSTGDPNPANNRDSVTTVVS